MNGLMRTLFFSLLLIVGTVIASPAAAAQKAKPKAPLQLSLGDSWATGFGASDPSTEGYVPKLHEALAKKRLKKMGLLNVAVGGATTPSMIAGQFPEAIPILEARNGNRKRRDDVEITTLHIGGNDVTNPIIAACLGGITPSCLAVINAEFAAYRSDLTTALSTLRDAAGDETIVIGTYDNPIASCNLGAVPGAVQLADLVLEGGGPVPQGLHDIIRDVADDHGVQVAEVYGDLGSEDWVGGADCLHPDDSGYDKVTDAFLETLGAT